MSDDARTYHAVCNDEGQYSIWPTAKPIPAGWTATGVSGIKDACLAYIREQWTDLRPRTLRAWMGE